MNKLLISLLFVFTCTGFARAQSTAVQNEQAYDNYMAANKTMQKAYRKALSEAGGYEDGVKQALIKTQEAFLAYRKKEQALQQLIYKGGSMQPLFTYQALTALTKARTRQLTLYVERL